MGFFRKKSVLSPTVVGDPLSVVPMKPDNVAVSRDSRGFIRLKIAPPLSPLKRGLARWLRYEYSEEVELDEYGSFFYSLVDGERTLDAIADDMAQKLDKDRKETVRTVVTFTKSLMLRNMLVLKVPARN